MEFYVMSTRRDGRGLAFRSAGAYHSFDRGRFLELPLLKPVAVTWDDYRVTQRPSKFACWWPHDS